MRFHYNIDDIDFYSRRFDKFIKLGEYLSIIMNGNDMRTKKDGHKSDLKYFIKKYPDCEDVVIDIFQQILNYDPEDLFDILDSAKGISDRTDIIINDYKKNTTMFDGY